jgi:hypothetical protein
MSETLDLPVNFQDEELLFKMEMIKWGYTHRFKIMVNGAGYFFEPDEEGTYRAVVENSSDGSSRDLGLLKVIGETLDELMK